MSLCDQAGYHLFTFDSTACVCGKMRRILNRPGEPELAPVPIEPRHDKIVIAGDYAEYQDWLRRTGNSPREYRYVHEWDNIAGMSPSKDDIVFVGRYWLNPLNNSDHLKMLAVIGGFKLEECRNE